MKIFLIKRKIQFFYQQHRMNFYQFQNLHQVNKFVYSLFYFEKENELIQVIFSIFIHQQILLHQFNREFPQHLQSIFVH